MTYVYNKRDTNERELLQLWAQAGAFCIQMPRLAGFDVLIAHHSALYVVEIKDGTLPPHKRELTDHEHTVRAGFLQAGVPYNVIEDRIGASDLLGLPHQMPIAEFFKGQKGTRGRGKSVV